MSNILTGREVISALATKIRAGFSTTEIQAIYKDTPVENILKPCIFLNLVNIIQTPLMRNRANRNYMIDIIVTGSDDNTELYTWYTEIAEKLYTIIDKIIIDNKPIRLIRGESTIENNELHLITTYNFDIIKQTDDEVIKMQTRKFEGRVI